MRFITEMDLRELYKAKPFTAYVLEPDTKITPGGRQFLVDRGVKMEPAKCSDGKKENTSALHQAQGRASWCALRLRAKMQYTESLFYLIGAELLSYGDVTLSEEIMALGKCFQDVQNSEREQIVSEKIKFWGWTEDEIKNCFNNLGKYFDICDIHVRLENGKVIALLNHLRASLQEVEPAILETYWNEEKQGSSREELIDKVNLIIMILCIMLRKCLEGQKCKM